jgi:hypothetical protein
LHRILKPTFVHFQKFYSGQKLNIMKYNLQIITAALMSIGGLALLFCGICIEPQGEIHESLLIGFGEVATFAGTLFGIDAAYTKKLWDITNLFAKHATREPNPSEAPSAKSNTAIPAQPESTKNT